jgi:hypothetical protein
MPALLPGALTRPGMTSRAPVGRRGSVAPVAVARPRSGRPAPPTAIAPPAEATSLVFSEGSATPVGGDAPASVGSAGLSYSEQYDSLWATGEPLDVKRVSVRRRGGGAVGFFLSAPPRAVRGGAPP